MLSKNLIQDLIDPQKYNDQKKNIINKLGQKTLIDTMKLIEKSLNDEDN